MENETHAPTRFVTARELGRRTGRLLDAVAEGTRLVVTRHGVPAATIVSTENVALFRRARAISATEPFKEEEPEIDLTELALPEHAEGVLQAYTSGRVLDHVVNQTGLSVGEVSIATARLELEKAVARGPGGYIVTRFGERVLAALQQVDQWD